MNKQQEARIREALFQALGAASVCWTPWPEGEFNSNRAVEIGEVVMDIIKLEWWTD